MLDTQSVHAAAGVPADTTGRDPAKKVQGRKRGLAVDVLRLVSELDRTINDLRQALDARSDGNPLVAAVLAQPGRRH